MRIALISDIHGNPLALDAVLADARDQGVDQHWFLGDFAAIGPEPVAVLETVSQIWDSSFCRGNTDRYVVTGDRPPPALSRVQGDPSLIETYTNIAASFAWTQGYVTAAGWFEWLAQLPLDIRWTAPSGARLLAVHASPGTDDGIGIHAGRSDEELTELLTGADADVVFVGHTHEAFARRVGESLVVNVGSVSNPTSPDLRASYVLVDASATGIELEFRRVAYDHDAFIERVHRSRHPATEFILHFQRGENAPRAPHRDHAPLGGPRILWPLGPA